MNNNAPFFRIIILLAIASVTGCVSSSSTDTAPYACSYPCLNATPTVSSTTVSSATGGTVTVDVDITGNIADVVSVFVYLADSSTGNGATGMTGRVDNPTQNLNTISITVPANATPGTYYPWISIRYANPASSGGEYILHKGVSSSKYTFYEWTPSGNTASMQSPFTISYISIQ